MVDMQRKHTENRYDETPQRHSEVTMERHNAGTQNRDTQWRHTVKKQRRYTAETQKRQTVKMVNLLTDYVEPSVPHLVRV